MNKPQPFIFSDGKVRELDEHFFAKAERGRPALPKAPRQSHARRRCHRWLEGQGQHEC